jgi:hypothetical protein
VTGASPSFAVLLNTTGSAPPPTPAAPSLLSPAQDATPAQPVAFDWSDVSGAVFVSSSDRQFEHHLLAVHRQPDRDRIAVRRAHFGSWSVLVAGAGHHSAGTAGPFSPVRRFTIPAAPPAAATLSAISMEPIERCRRALHRRAPRLDQRGTRRWAGRGRCRAALRNCHRSGIRDDPIGQQPSHVQQSHLVSDDVDAGDHHRNRRRSHADCRLDGDSAVTIGVADRDGNGSEWRGVVSSPAGVNVAVGSTGSAPFATGTAITLSVSNGRDAIWSGACSSGGNKTRSCTFTFNANASVTANVQ